MVSLKELQENNEKIASIINNVKHDITTLQHGIQSVIKAELIKENNRLMDEIKITKAELIALEKEHGRKQVALPIIKKKEDPCNNVDSSTIQSVEEIEKNDKQTVVQKTQSQVIKDKKECKSKMAIIPPIDVRRLDMRIGRIMEISRHPDADTLYIEKIDCGELQPRTVVSGLVNYVTIENMQNRLVIVLCNLKPVKMRGIVSEAMLMCASTTDKVEILDPPLDAVPGDLVYCENYPREPDIQLNPKKKIFEICAPDLKTNEDLIACFKGSKLYVPDKGNIMAQSLKNVQVK